MNELNDLICQLEIFLFDEFGLINNYLNENHKKKYDDFDTITAWECFVDEVNRIQSIVKLYEFLVKNKREIEEL